MVEKFPRKTQENPPSYSRIKKENPKLHHEISDVAIRDIPPVMEEIKKGKIEAERMLPLEDTLRDVIGELRSIQSVLEREENIQDSSTVRELIDDTLKCFDNLRSIRELTEIQKSGNPHGYSPFFIRKAIESAQQELPILAERIDAFSFPGTSRHAWNELRARFRPNMIVALAAFGIALSPMAAETPGLETFSPLAAYADIHAPEMHQQGKEAGKFEKGGEIARVQGNLPDFFVTQVYEFDENGKRILVSLDVSHSLPGTARGTISLPATRYEKGVPIPLILPLGFVAKNIKTSPSVSFTLAQDHLVFNEHSRGPLRVEYDVAPTEKSPYLSQKTKKEFPLPALPELKKLLAEVATNPDAPETAIYQYLKDFTYIVSSELQEMIDRIPGSIEYKTALIKAGDCDVLADHLAYALKKHVSTGVAKGFWNADRDDILHAGEGHARLIYNTKDNLLKAIETTEYPKRSFVNVVFLEEDHALLEQKIREIEHVPQKQKEAQIRIFGQTLETILKKDAYLSFRPKGGLASALSNMSSNESAQRETASGKNATSQGEKVEEGSQVSTREAGKATDGIVDTIQKFHGFDNLWLNIALAALLEAVVLALGVGATALALKKIRRHVREGNLRKDIDLFEGLDRGELPEGNQKASGQMEAEFRDLCYDFSIPQEVANKLSGEEKEIIVLLNAMRDEEKFFLISQLLASGRIKANAFRKTLTELAQSQETVTKKDILDTIRDVCESEKTRSVAQAAQAQAVDRIWNIVRNYHLNQIEKLSEEEQLGDILDMGPTIDGGKASRHPGSDEFHQLRQYQKGDDIRYMARKRGAADEPLVREFRAGMSGENKQSFHLVVDLPSVDDWEVGNLIHLLALAHKRKGVSIHGIDFYAFGVPIQQQGASAMRKLIGTPRLNIEGFRKLIEIIVAGRVRESIHVASRYSSGVNSYSGSMLPAHIYEPLSQDHTVLYLGDARNVTTIRHIVHMKTRASSAGPKNELA